MSFEAEFKKVTLKFGRPMGTSRGVLHERDTYILSVTADGQTGLGECAPLPGLSVDDHPGIEAKLQQVCDALRRGQIPTDEELLPWPSVRFAVEAALRDLRNGGKQQLFESDFTRGVASLATNGLVVMDSIDNMFRQVVDKVAAGFQCIKIKIGALDFEAECNLLARIREAYPPEQIELRLDANGAFADDDALERIDRLARFGIHSIEQPVKPRHWDAMAFLCHSAAIPVAWDEELIGVTEPDEQAALVEAFRPAYLVLKPTLLGGLKAAEEWIAIARKHDVGYWVTSALESNVGLNIISQWAATLGLALPQGLGTGQLFEQNFTSPLSMSEGRLHFSPGKKLTPLKLQ